MGMLAVPTVGIHNSVWVRQTVRKPRFSFICEVNIVLRFRLNELIAECNQSRAAGERLHMQSVADAIEVPRSTLAGLTTLHREPTTNTATLEALSRFFQLNHPDFNIANLFEFDPSLPETTEIKVDILYPERAAKKAEARRQRGGQA